jgi:hypothetical protein
MENENPGKMKYFVGILMFVVIIAFGMTLYFFGGQGVLKFMLYFFIVIMVLTVLFLIVYAVYWLFKLHPIDTIHVNKTRILKACLSNPPPTPSTLWFMGDQEWEYKQVGFLTGVCRIAHRKKIKEVNEETREEEEVTKEYYEDCLSFRKTKGLISALFGNHEIVRVLPEERTSLNADKVFLKAMSFAPEKFGFFFLPNRFRDGGIRKMMVDEVRDVTLQEVMKEEVNIAMEGIAISPAHQKAMEKSNMQQIAPGGGGGQTK